MLPVVIMLEFRINNSILIEDMNYVFKIIYTLKKSIVFSSTVYSVQMIDCFKASIPNISAS